jgi:hypothetical protein
MTTLENYSAFRAELVKRNKELLESLSQYDFEITDLLHYLENEKCDAVQMVLVAKRLKETRIKRRIVKTELEQIQSLNDQLRSERHMKCVGGSKYKYRTDALKDIGNREKGHVIKIAKKHI